VYLRLKDRIKFAITFFKALKEGEDSVKIEVVRAKILSRSRWCVMKTTCIR
jgi:hypothetical protein